MKCPKCGYENKDDALWCYLCYEILRRNEQQKTSDRFYEQKELLKSENRGLIDTYSEKEDRPVTSKISFSKIIRLNFTIAMWGSIIYGVVNFVQGLIYLMKVGVLKYLTTSTFLPMSVVGPVGYDPILSPISLIVVMFTNWFIFYKFQDEPGARVVVFVIGFIAGLMALVQFVCNYDLIGEVLDLNYLLLLSYISISSLLVAIFGGRRQKSYF